jgi:hypothetical protein
VDGAGLVGSVARHVVELPLSIPFQCNISGRRAFRRYRLGTAAKRIDPENYILSVLSPEDRLDAAFRIAGEAFKKKRLTMNDIEKAVKSVRRKSFASKK